MQDSYDHFLVFIGNVMSVFFTGAIFATAEIGMKIVAFILAAGAAGTTWRYNAIKIKQAEKDIENRKNKD